MNLREKERVAQKHADVCLAFLIGTILPFQEFAWIGLPVMGYLVYSLLERDKYAIQIAQQEQKRD